MALFLLCPNLGWIQGQFNFTEDSLRYRGDQGGFGDIGQNVAEEDPIRKVPAGDVHRL
jgi:hypothetical protein